MTGTVPWLQCNSTLCLLGAHLLAQRVAQHGWTLRHLLHSCCCPERCCVHLECCKLCVLLSD